MGLLYFESNSKLFVNRRHDYRWRKVTTSNGRNDRIDWFPIRHYRFYLNGEDRCFFFFFDKVKSRTTIERLLFVSKKNSMAIKTPTGFDLYHREQVACIREEPQMRCIVFVLKFCGNPALQHDRRAFVAVFFLDWKKHVIRTQQCPRTARGAQRASGP